ncbi:MAG: ATP-dependent helicase [Kiritimatiellaceae bacterium]|nr:MAG: ATP-dependent helicase [Kiritimatiellaceae bacterium]|tara:strand:+ start:1459 stop:3393 length:1935 start_codon:yes stop_codon:yes gene_type:complete
MNFKEALNAEQYAAVTAPDGPALVVAAAGTGKTRTLIYRLAWLVTQRGVEPWEVLLLTFTNKAASEMLSRAEELVQRRFNSGFSGTFHSFANRLLRQHADRVGFGKDFSILDADDAKKLMRNCADELGMDKKMFPKPDVLLSLFGVVSGRQGDLRAAVEERFEHAEVEVADILKVQALYTEKKRTTNTMDFDDLLIYAHALLSEHADVRAFYQDAFRHVLVDEYQDTNVLQAAMVRQLVSGHGNLMVVGDDFQSIYSWRGADFRNFLDFAGAYEGAATYKLQTNYRSTPQILETANAVIAGNPEQFQKELRAVRGAGQEPRLARMRDGSSQARFIIEEVRRLAREGVSASECCVLYRSHFHAMELQMELAREQVPYVVTSGVRFFEQAHIKDCCSVLRLIANPADGLAFSRLVELFPKVGAKTAQKIFAKLGGRANVLHGETLEQLGSLLPAAAQESWQAIKPIFVAYREEKLEEDPGEVIFRFNKAFYGAYMAETFENHRFRGEDVDGLIDFTVKFESVENFLAEVALLTNLDTDAAAKAEQTADEHILRLSTVHQAKGLEWKAVFVLFVNEEMFPSKKTVEEQGDSEERRLFYVAVTRAEDHLYLCAPMVRRQRDGGIQFLDPSRFIEEIPDEFLVEEKGFF